MFFGFSFVWKIDFSFVLGVFNANKNKTKELQTKLKTTTNKKRKLLPG